MSRTSLSVAGSRSPSQLGIFPRRPGALSDWTLIVQGVGGRRVAPLLPAHVA
jgi:hypothetical protein